MCRLLSLPGPDTNKGVIPLRSAAAIGVRRAALHADPRFEIKIRKLDYPESLKETILSHDPCFTMEAFEGFTENHGDITGQRPQDYSVSA